MAAPAPSIVIRHEFDTTRIEKVGERAGDLRPLWINDVQPLITDFLTQRFDSKGAYEGQRWADLSPATIELRKRPGHGRGGIGRDTNHMWASWVKSAGSTPAPGGVLVLTKDRFERGSTLPQSLFFHGGINSTTKPVYVETKSGTKRWVFVRRKAPKRIPGRPIIPDPLPRALVEQVELSLRAYLSGSGDA